MTTDKKRMFLKLDDRAVIPSMRPEDVGLDVSVVRIRETENIVYADTGLATCPPPGYYFELIARSSLHKRGWALANAVGVIDPGYRGEIIVALIRLWPTAETSAISGRIAQLVLRRHYTVESVVAESQDDFAPTTRGTGGFGSTGI